MEGDGNGEGLVKGVDIGERFMYSMPAMHCWHVGRPPYSRKRPLAGKTYAAGMATKDSV